MAFSCNLSDIGDLRILRNKTAICIIRKYQWFLQALFTAFAEQYAIITDKIFIFLIYMKRWMARFWQECGARVYADLNVARKFYEYNKLGIPQGYNAFATRGYADREEYLKQEIDIARDISGLDKPNMIVYGGGERIREICLHNNVLYVEQFMANRVKPKKKGGNNG